MTAGTDVRPLLSTFTVVVEMKAFAFAISDMVLRLSVSPSRPMDLIAPRPVPPMKFLKRESKMEIHGFLWDIMGQHGSQWNVLP